MFRIKKLDIFITKQFGLLFVGTFVICQFVLMMQFLWRWVDILIGKGLALEILAQFFWYMGLMLVPQALPLAILLSSLIVFGNLGESSELTAIKAAGISLMQSFRSLILLSCLIAIGSFYFQNNVGPEANSRLNVLIQSMRHKNPELEIPEGIFYDGIPQSNLYVQKKNRDTGVLYGIMIYRMTDSYEDAAIILADSGRLQTTADRKHLLLTLYSGEWFENMRSTEFGSSASVPYRRETFLSKRIVLDFDSDFSLEDGGSMSNNARTKSLSQIRKDLDSLNHQYDSVGREIYRDMVAQHFTVHHLRRSDSLKALKQVAEGRVVFDSLYQRLPDEQRKNLINSALNTVKMEASNLDFRAMLTSDGDQLIREHDIEAISKFTLALSCLIFFFIGAPLGAIIRKGGLGVPVIISVLVYIIYYILDNSGYRMARGGMWTVWFGKGLAPAVLIPLSIFITYKANNDSVVFNIDLYRNFFMRLFGLRLKRHVAGKEVIINDPDYRADAERLETMTADIRAYAGKHRLLSMPNVIRLFFKYEPDHEIERIGEELENIIEDLSNTRDKVILSALNAYPFMSLKAHTRPFERKWLNIASFVVIPLGAVLYVRIWMFRVRLIRDLRTITRTNEHIIARIVERQLA
ncbi:LptF/LptG family permease [Hoylesella marshii]|uniref:Permease, YjgP/YjgQ family n=1 Tax=Hoylesella marshii DSM 16973 = JCM 13450 TaxID=862515 RepID=E0NTB2_9BACT|nr:LptF/LptG family permease [Hoylesella marshii]EFM01579.1 permease, YjgP/YjgQ family [Hoylesella marshii DSM 16973 = JCM 13450]